MEDTLRRATADFEKHLASIDELTHVVLKGHLLLEKAINQAIDATFPNPQYISKLNFSQKYNLLRAVDVQLHTDPIWDLIAALNTLRNDVAHSLDSPKTAIRIESLRQAYFKAASGYERLEDHRSYPDGMIISAAAALAVGVIIGLRSRGESIVLAARVLSSVGE